MTEPRPTAEPPRPTLERRPLREQIRQYVTEAVVAGRWAPGERIVERRVAVELGVSQAPVREALRELEQLGLVESEPNKGVRVRSFSETDLREIYPVRAGLEETAARLALPRIDDERLAALDRHVAALHAASTAGDAAAQVRHGVAFHREIVAASGNALLGSVWEALGIEVWTTLSIRVYRMDLHENAADHEPIVAAFRRRDPATGALLREHVLGYGGCALLP
ncbi:GntR family transcriptional regulator [Embleya hyalina]|uniref:GntR family transcriptional regulator n=1 Tax=Embleya hyalina TaxID=516124 RepID=A0A401Z509_9ACTN|nr:GntR family transcriptional regulator [Embleya hyalina]GCE01933.1 GntR family transcriptional regulator [Embleya hyalina]